jgi:hypothetical protein
MASFPMTHGGFLGVLKDSSTSELIQNNALRMIRESAHLVGVINSRNIGKLSTQDQQEINKAVGRILRYSRQLELKDDG